jgi:hypothetical protein
MDEVAPVAVSMLYREPTDWPDCVAYNIPTVAGTNLDIPIPRNTTFALGFVVSLLAMLIVSLVAPASVGLKSTLKRVELKGATVVGNVGRSKRENAEGLFEIELMES